MWHVWETAEVHTGFWCGGLREGNHLEDLRVDNINMALREVGRGGMDWIDLAEDRDWLRALVNAVISLRVP